MRDSSRRDMCVWNLVSDRWSIDLCSERLGQKRLVR